MSRECDFFSDSYGCVITHCIGYQCPFPLVRFGSGFSGGVPRGPLVQAACFIATSTAPPSTPTGRLLTFDLRISSPCCSMMHLLSSTWKTQSLLLGSDFIRKIDGDAQLTGVVSRSREEDWSFSVYSRSAEDPNTSRQALMKDITTAAVREAMLWMCGGGDTAASSTPLYYSSAEDVYLGRPCTSVRVHHRHHRCLDVVALTDSTAVLLTSGGAVLADARQRSAVPQVRLPVSNGGVARDNQLVLFGDKGSLDIFDLRKSSEPCYTTSSASYLRVRCQQEGRYVLLTSHDAVAVFDLAFLTPVASVHHTHDAVLDATLVPATDSEVRLCTSTESGMFYEWRVSV